MPDKITSPDQLKALAAKAKADIDLRHGRKESQVTVHMGTCGIAAGARDVVAAFMTELAAAGVTSVQPAPDRLRRALRRGADGDGDGAPTAPCTATACSTRTRCTRS